MSENSSPTVRLPSPPIRKALTSKYRPDIAAAESTNWIDSPVVATRPYVSNQVGSSPGTSSRAVRPTAPVRPVWRSKVALVSRNR